MMSPTSLRARTPLELALRNVDIGFVPSIFVHGIVGLCLVQAIGWLAAAVITAASVTGDVGLGYLSRRWRGRIASEDGHVPRQVLYAAIVAMGLRGLIAALAPAAAILSGHPSGQLIAICLIAGNLMAFMTQTAVHQPLMWAAASTAWLSLAAFGIDRAIHGAPDVAVAAAALMACSAWIALLSRRAHARYFRLLAQSVQTGNELAAARTAAETANAAKSAFLANMSHEIRTPLNGVVGLAGVLQTSHLDQRQSELVGAIVQSGEALNRVLSDLLDLSKIEAGKLEVAPVVFDLGDAVRTAAGVMQARAFEKGLALTVDVSTAVAGTWIGDPVRIGQIVTNFVSNAVKFTATGRVSVHADLVETGGANPDSQMISIRVTDSGPGIEPAVAARLFQRFEQGDASISRQHGGTGLGLAIAAGLAEAMGGTVGLQSVAGEGATFDLRLPLRRTDSPAVTPAPSATPDTGAHGTGETDADHQPLSVLVAEDHPMNRKVVQLVLEQIGAQVTMVEEGQAAVHAFASGRYDVVLMDMQMPVLDGLSATREIREIEARTRAERTPILMLSANAMVDHVAQSLEAGCDGHVAKPITPDQLINAIAHAMAPGPGRHSHAAV
jgi:two-component system, sensor histidine kinase